MKRSTVCEENRDLILRMMKEGKYLYQIAKAVGKHTKNVRAFLRREGLYRPFQRSGPREKNGHWNGGRVIDKSGYVLIHKRDHPYSNKDGYVREHRLVMEQVLGRFLKRKEVVHHKNKKKDDNRPENLELFERNSEHLRLELRGHVPKWTPDGLARMNAGASRGREILRIQNLLKSKPCGSPSP